jgi:DHA1 family bicyclomycin/chloramphenicol resistance-like MFS transporter
MPKRRPLHIASLLAATKELARHRVIVISTLVQALTLGALFATLSSMHGIFEARFDRAETFPLWFAFIAVGSMSGSLLNSRIVMGLGMRRVVTGTFAAQLGLTLLCLLTISTGLMPEALAFPAHLLWSIGLFSMMGLTMGNLNALAMEPVGHIAGLAASVISSLATVGSVLLAIPVGLAFNGTVLPLLSGVAVLLTAALALMRFGLPPR